MRRRTPGVIGPKQLISQRIARLERESPEAVIRALEPFVQRRRKDRMRSVLERRLSSVRTVFDNPHDPHNGAAVIRSSEAFGVQTLHMLTEHESFLMADSVARGAQRWVDVFVHREAKELVQTLQAGGYELVQARADGELLPSDLAEIPKLALVLGNEHHGVGPVLGEGCKRSVRIPMRGFVESLNVSVVCATLLAYATAGRPGDLPEAERRRLYARGLYFSATHPNEILEAAGLLPPLRR